MSQYFIVLKPNHTKCAVQVVDSNEVVLKTYYYPCGSEEKLREAYDKADKYIDELKAKD